MVTKKTWQEFKNTGLLFFINQILHAFGWSIVIGYDDYNKETESGTIKEVYPARVKFRGFNEISVDKGYNKISKYLKDNSIELYNEIQEESEKNQI